MQALDSAGTLAPLTPQFLLLEDTLPLSGAELFARLKRGGPAAKWTSAFSDFRTRIVGDAAWTTIKNHEIPRYYSKACSMRSAPRAAGGSQAAFSSCTAWLRLVRPDTDDYLARYRSEAQVATKKVASRQPQKGSKKLVRIDAPGSKFMPGERVSGRRVRKNMDMDPAKLAAVKEILGAPTETEAVDRAFDEIIFEHKVSAGLDKVTATGGLPKVDPDA